MTMPEKLYVYPDGDRGKDDYLAYPAEDKFNYDIYGGPKIYIREDIFNEALNIIDLVSKNINLTCGDGKRAADFLAKHRGVGDGR